MHLNANCEMLSQRYIRAAELLTQPARIAKTHCQAHLKRKSQNAPCAWLSLKRRPNVLDPRGQLAISNLAGYLRQEVAEPLQGPGGTAGSGASDSLLDRYSRQCGVRYCEGTSKAKPTVRARTFAAPRSGSRQGASASRPPPSFHLGAPDESSGDEDKVQNLDTLSLGI